MQLNTSIIAITLVFLTSLPSSAEANALKPGDTVLVNGRFERKCSAMIESIPSPGFARLTFAQASCGDRDQAYKIKNLQRLTFNNSYKKLQKGDAVVLDGFMGGKCSGRVKEISKSGYTAVDLDSFLCADSAALHKAGTLTRVDFVQEAEQEGKKFTVGQRVSTNGIHEKEICKGKIEKLTNNGLAEISFDELTCAYEGKLYSIADLNLIAAPKAKFRATGDAIFKRVMREIASSKKAK